LAGGWVALGLLELALDDLESAARAFDAALDIQQQRRVADVGGYWFVPDLVEALVGLGEVERADRHATDLEARASRRNQDTDWAQAVAARARSLVLAAQGDASALELTSTARTAGVSRRSFNVARALFVAGVVHRRLHKKRSAVELLEEAARRFEEMPAPLHAARARKELDRIGGRPTTNGVLTDAERRVAELVALGRTNQEVAADLLLSPKTVEWNLSKIYKKLGVRGRAELAAKLARR
jgi:DNA-binding CsgD family transcriptional regulator